MSAQPWNRILGTLERSMADIGQTFFTTVMIEGRKEAVFKMLARPVPLSVMAWAENGAFSEIEQSGPLAPTLLLDILDTADIEYATVQCLISHFSQESRKSYDNKLRPHFL
jgi:hypothetical protein